MLRSESGLNKLGEDGWELVAIIGDMSQRETSFRGIAYFKQPIDEAARNRERTNWNEELQAWQVNDSK